MRAAGWPAEKAQDFSVLRQGRWLRWLMCSAVFFALPWSARAQTVLPPPLPRTNLGTVGLIEMPSARMGPDGELSAGASFFKDNQHYNLGFNVLPWLEASFRYSGLQHFDTSASVYWDRSFAMKARLWDESGWRPALAVGINDLVGTGLYSGEYIVASKQFGDFDATLGVGWGRLGSANTFRNPFAQLSHSFEIRPSLTTAGGANFKTYFHGATAGLFGGVVWNTPVPGLSLIAESSSDSYPFERVASSFTGGGFFPKNQMNYGVSYKLDDTTTLALDWLYGRAIGGNVSFQFDPSRYPYPATIAPPPIAPVLRSQDEQREALRTLLERRSNAPDRAIVRARTNEKNAFVDSLLQDASITDIRVSGATLSISLAAGATVKSCQAIAAMARHSGAGIREVVLHGGNGRAAIHCPVTRELEAPRLQSASFDTIAGLDYAALEAPLLQIDASVGAPREDGASALREFKAAAKKQDIQILAVSFSDSEATVYYYNGRYYSEAEAIERLTRLLMAYAPPNIEKFRLIATFGVPQQEYTVLRSPAERALSQPGDDVGVFDSPVSIAAAPLNNPLLSAGRKDTFPSFGWDVYPQFRQELFDPNNPFGVQFLGAANAYLSLAPGLSLYGTGEISAFDTFATARKSNSLLPHVRTGFLNYFTEGKNGIANLGVSYQFRLTPEVYAMAKAGYLESMFAGFGGEVLWRPEGKRWAFGADIYDVKQRDFDRLFGLQPYHVITGHVSVYYASPFYDLDFMLRAGQYLAGDRGLTLQVTRRFSTGVEIGAFFTKTNVSATQFGEGEFDKGIIIRIPLGWVAPISTQSEIGFDLRPVQRDGGQPLAGDAVLYDATRRASESEIYRNGKTFSDE